MYSWRRYRWRKLYKLLNKLTTQLQLYQDQYKYILYTYEYFFGVNILTTQLRMKNDTSRNFQALPSKQKVFFQISNLRISLLNTQYGRTSYAYQNILFLMRNYRDIFIYVRYIYTNVVIFVLFLFFTVTIFSSTVV